MPRHLIRARALAGTVLLAMVLSACATRTEVTGSTSVPGTDVSAGASATPASTEPAAGAASADLDFTAVTLEGEDFSGTQLAGQPAVLWFWAPWCPTCRAQEAGVSALASEYQDEVAVVAVGGLSDPQDIRDVAAGISGPTHLIDEEGVVWRHFGVTAQSSYLVIDEDGSVISEGYLDDDALGRMVADLTR